MSSLLLCIVLNVDQSVLLCSLCVLDIVTEFDLFPSSLSPFTAILLFTVSSTLSGGDSKFILYSNRITKLYIPKTYSITYSNSNIYSIAYTISEHVSSSIYSIEERQSRSCASHLLYYIGVARGSYALYIVQDILI